MSFPLPPTRFFKSPLPYGDMNQVVQALLGMGAATLVAPANDPTGVADATLVNNVANGFGGAGGAVLLSTPTPATGPYYFKAGLISIPNAGVSIMHVGPKWACPVKGVGTGDVIRMYSTTSYSPGSVAGGGCEGFMLDISAMGAGSAGIHAGDIYNLKWDVGVRGSGPNSKNYWFDNNYFWAEQMYGRIFSEQGQVIFDNSANISGQATGSFDRPNLDIMCDNKGASNLVVLQNGAQVIDPVAFNIFGNTDYGAALYYVLTLTGSNVANGFSVIRSGTLNIGVECNGTSGTQPGTIKFNTPGPNGNVITATTGMLDFGANNAFAHASGFQGSFEHDGPIVGDSGLPRSRGTGQARFANGAIGNGGTIVTRWVGQSVIAPTANVTGLILQAPTLPNGGISIRVSVHNNSAFTATFDVPATSHVADGTSDVIAANTAAIFEWNTDANLWFRCQ